MRVIRRLIGRRAWLRIRTDLWAVLIAEMGLRADGHREAGAFLLGRRDDPRLTVVECAYYDDLDANSLTGGISFGFEGFAPLWDLCDLRNLRVVGDVHTHGGRSITQSSTDRENPMVARVGHIALIVPYLAARPVGPHEVGVHRYLGDEGWQSCTGREAASRLYVGRWA
jgi:hypothetical protein